MTSTPDQTVLLFYKYAHLDDLPAITTYLRDLCTKLGLVGRVLLSLEGINSNLAGTASGITAFCEALSQHPLFGGIDFKLDSSSQARPFPDLAIKVVDEIVSTGGTIPYGLLEQG
jgi:UPF0176 protein